VRIECAGAIVFDERGRLLLIQRGHEPSKGKWSLPGGRIEVGESAEEAAVREVREETRLDVRISRLAGEVEWQVGDDGQAEQPSDAGADSLHILDFVGERIDPTQVARAGDDAADVRWVTCSELTSVETTDGLLDCLADWGVMPTAP
jgi:8-oxo-dGTP diphosphatase